MTANTIGCMAIIQDYLVSHQYQLIEYDSCTSATPISELTVALLLAVTASSLRRSEVMEEVTKALSTNVRLLSYKGSK